MSHSRAAAAADGMLCVFVYIAGEGTLWEKLLAMVRIDERKIRVLSGLGQAWIPFSCVRTSSSV